MSTHLTASLWPSNFDPDDTTLPVSATVVDRIDPATAGDLLHRHVTGQLSVAVEGLSGIQTEQGLWMIPLDCGVWIPPGQLHNAVLGTESRMFSCHIPPALTSVLPDRPVTIMLSNLAIELIRTLAARELPLARAKRIGAVLLDELSEARRLPINYAVMSHHPVLREIAQACTQPEYAAYSNTQWAQKVAMSEKTLSRLVFAETGMSFQNWRRRIRLLASLNALARGKSVEAVAFDAGYTTPSAFIAVFKKLFGETPGNFFKR
ncbi:MAG: helix-turn-helix transcriptional regulator [Sutterellaceae bacterium]|nr:helix-turn-helix transcriptional regulator [Sutterellaceae bacterium]